MIINNKDISFFDDLKAETVVSVVSPDVKHWKVLHKGYFYRNYHNDIINLDTINNYIETSRNGLMKILPEGLFFNPQQLKVDEKDDFKEKKKKLDEIRKFYSEFFIPFDSELFDISLRIENYINESSDKSLANWLRAFLDIDLEILNDTYTKALVPMILGASKIRGNFLLITQLLSAITNCEVSYAISKFKVKFVVHKTNLNAVEYKNFNNELKRMFKVVEDWFIPMEYTVEYMIKDYKQRLVLSSEKPLLLNYNTNF